MMSYKEMERELQNTRLDGKKRDHYKWILAEKRRVEETISRYFFSHFIGALNPRRDGNLLWINGFNQTIKLKVLNELFPLTFPIFWHLYP